MDLIKSYSRQPTTLAPHFTCSGIIFRVTFEKIIIFSTKHYFAWKVAELLSKTCQNKLKRYRQLLCSRLLPARVSQSVTHHLCGRKRYRCGRTLKGYHCLLNIQVVTQKLKSISYRDFTMRHTSD